MGVDTFSYTYHWFALSIGTDFNKCIGRFPKCFAWWAKRTWSSLCRNVAAERRSEGLFDILRRVHISTLLTGLWQVLSISTQSLSSLPPSLLICRVREYIRANQCNYRMLVNRSIEIRPLFPYLLGSHVQILRVHFFYPVNWFYH